MRISKFLILEAILYVHYSVFFSKSALLKPLGMRTCCETRELSEVLIGLGQGSELSSFGVFFSFCSCYFDSVLIKRVLAFISWVVVLCSIRMT